ncbi:chromate transporter [Paenibacillus motobuensis]|uniref:chromate transporter n=1 Tax=Paenibacillus TaxID=44249 RepID=UPI00203DB1C2|nr:MULTISPECIES: chromate transporter [Paenibacillus]MCM3040637.1 chromate transporter [Paenibacillus lutimineralis]MCM3647741.1 chromate transporter [Paenibacillus motobuensis]
MTKQTKGTSQSKSPIRKQRKGSILEILGASTKLGLTSFGGPIAHLGYFREEYVTRRKWLDEKSYADLVALCQFLPGPASSQVGISIGMMRGGLLGGITSWIGFTLPSALALAFFAYAMNNYDVGSAGWLNGLMIAAVAIVAQAVWGMARSLAPDRIRGTIAILVAIITLLWPSAYTQLILIAVAGLFGRLFLAKSEVTEVPHTHINTSIHRRAAVIAWTLFFGLLIGLPLLRTVVHSRWLALFDTFYRAGSLVFGGGHVVLPILQAEMVPPGWLTDAQFLTGYGAAQAVPGPLFTFSAYLGTVVNGWAGAIVALLAMFLPSFLLVIGTLPYWNTIRRRPNFQAIFKGINAAVVGILLAALYDPVWTKAIHTPYDFCLALAAFGMLMLWKLPPWMVVLFSAAGGAVISLLS